MIKRIARIGKNREYVDAWKKEGVKKKLQTVVRIERLDGRLDGWFPLPLPPSAQFSDLYAVDPRDWQALPAVIAAGHLDKWGVVVRVVKMTT